LAFLYSSDIYSQARRRVVVAGAIKRRKKGEGEIVKRILRGYAYLDQGRAKFNNSHAIGKTW
jgi:hypothetical protein